MTCHFPAGELECGVCSRATHRFCARLSPTAYAFGLGWVCSLCRIARCTPFCTDDLLWAAARPELLGLLRVANDIYGHPLAPGTSRLYLGHIRRMVEWSRGRGVSLLPMTTLEQAFLWFGHLHHDRKLAWGTMANSRDAIAAWHAAAGLSTPFRQPGFLQWWTGLQRARRIMPQQKLPVRFTTFQKLWVALGRSGSLVDLRDRTLLSLLFLGVRRGADVLVNAAGTAGLRCCDVDFSDPDMVVFSVRRMKNDPFGAGHVFCIANVTRSGLRFREALLEYGRAGDLDWASEAPLIQSTRVNGTRLTGAAPVDWGKRFLRLLKTAGGIPASLLPRYGVHSLRRGGCSYALDCGVPEDLVRAHGAWTSDAFYLYVRRDMTRMLRVTSAF